MDGWVPSLGVKPEKLVKKVQLTPVHIWGRQAGQQKNENSKLLNFWSVLVSLLHFSAEL